MSNDDKTLSERIDFDEARKNLLDAARTTAEKVTEGTDESAQSIMKRAMKRVQIFVKDD